MISEATLMDPKPAADAPRGAVDFVLVRARGGDRAAFEALLRRHERLVFGTARRLLQAVEDAEDAAQEVFLRLHENLGRLDPERPLEAWLYRVTVNVCRTLGRKRRSREAQLLGDDAETLTSTAADPAAAAELEEEHRMVAEGLATLTRREQSALVLHDLEGLSTREVADGLGISEVTVRTHLCRARLKMRTFRERRHKGTNP